MARSLFRKTNQDGTVSVIYDDGSLVVWSADLQTVVSQSGPDAQRAAAFRSGDADAAREAMDRLDQQTLRRDQQLYDYNERAYGDSRSDRASDVRYRDRQADRAFGLDRDRFGLERDRFGLDRVESDRRYQFDVDQAERDWQLNQRRMGVDEGRLGYDIIRTDVDLRSTPVKWASLADWEEGVMASPNTPLFLQRLQQQQTAPGFNSPNQGSMPQQNSLAKVIGALEKNGVTDPRQLAAATVVAGMAPSSGAGWDAQDVAMLNAIGGLVQAGGARIAGQVDSLDQTQKDLITGGVARLGGDPNQFWDQAERGKIAQSSALRA